MFCFPHPTEEWTGLLSLNIFYQMPRIKATINEFEITKIMFLFDFFLAICEQAYFPLIIKLECNNYCICVTVGPRRQGKK